MANETLKHEVVIQPETAKTKILAAFKAVGANRDRTAKHLDISRSTLWRYCVTLKITKTIERLEKQAVRDGWIKRETPGAKPKVPRQASTPT